MEQAVSELARELDIAVTIPKTKINASRSDNYQDYYDVEMKELVEEKYGDDLKLFGYNFDGHDQRSLFKLKNLKFDHKKGKLLTFPANKFSSLSPTEPSGLNADIEFHPWGNEVLEQFTIRTLTSHILSRAKDRLLAREKNDQ